MAGHVTVAERNVAQAQGAQISAVVTLRYRRGEIGSVSMKVYHDLLAVHCLLPVLLALDPIMRQPRQYACLSSPSRHSPQRFFSLFIEFSCYSSFHSAIPLASPPFLMFVFFFLITRAPQKFPFFPYTPLFR